MYAWYLERFAKGRIRGCENKIIIVAKKNRKVLNSAISYKGRDH
jgi:hypothetical protein